MKSQPSVAIIGAGVNGLTCAAYLARAGFSVDIFEKAHRTGGLCVSETPFAGSKVQVSSLASSCLFLPESLVEELELPKTLKFYKATTPHIVLFENAQFSSDSLSNADKNGWAAFQAEMAKAAQLIYPYYLKPETNKAAIQEVLRLAGQGELARAIFSESLFDYAGKFFQDENLLAIIGAQKNIFAGQTGSIFAYIHETIDKTKLEGGMGKLSEALTKSAQSAGARIHLNKGVRALKTTGDLVTEIDFESGESLAFDIVIAATCQKTLFGSLLGENTPSGITVHVEVNKPRLTAARLHFLLRSLPRFTALQMLETHRSITLPISLQAAAKARESIERSTMPQALTLTLELEKSGDNETLLSVDVHHLPTTIKGKPWSEADDRALLALVIDTIEKYAPGFSELIKESYLISPRTLKESFNLEALSPWHQSAEFLFEQRALPTLPHYHTPFENLFICSASTYPTGDVTLANGHNLAKLICKSVDISPPNVLSTN